MLGIAHVLRILTTLILLGQGALTLAETIVIKPNEVGAYGQPSTPQATLRRDVERYLREQSRSLPGDVSFQIQLSETIALPECAEFSVSTPPSARTTGRSSVVVRCPASAGTWSILVPVQIQAVATYLVAARQIPAGQVVTEGDVVRRTGDLGLLPPGVITETDQAVGLTTRSAIGTGQPLRKNMLKAVEVIASGQQVKVTSLGAGFEVSNMGTALNAGGAGSTIRVRLSTGQVVVGTATAAGAVRLNY